MLGAAHRDLRGQPDRSDHKVFTVVQAPSVRRARRGRPVYQAPSDRKAHQDHPDLKENRGQKEKAGHKAQEGHQAIKDHLEFKVHREYLAFQGSKVRPARLAQSDRPDPKDRWVQQDPKGFPGI